MTRDEIYDHHIGILTLNHEGLIQSFSKKASEQLKDLKLGTSVRDYFPDIQLSEQVQSLHALNTYLLKRARITMDKTDDNVWTVFFSSETSNSSEGQLKQIHLAELAALGEMTSGLAHEIANPITVISGLARYIQVKLSGESPDLEEIVRRAGRIQKTTAKMAEIIQAIRKVARGKQEEIQFVDTDMRQILNEVVILTSFKLSNLQFKTNIIGESNRLTCECDGIQIMQVIINLVNNACDALKEKEKKELLLEIEDRGEIVALRVKDNALALPSELGDSIFHQHITTKEAGKGTGIGLYLSKKIVLLHQGEIKAYTDGVWTVFEVTIPKKRTELGDKSKKGAAA